MQRTTTTLALLTILCSAIFGSARADIEIDRDRLTITTKNVIAYFRGPDLVRLINRLTGEVYLNTSATTNPVIDIGMLEPLGKGLRWSDWRQGKDDGANPDAAQISLNDLTRSAWMNVVVDPETQDLMIAVWGSANREGVTGLTWGLRGIDLSSGRLVLPAQGGCCLDKDTAPSTLTLEYPTEWEAQMAVWEGKHGGFVLYTRDDQAISKKLHLTRRGDYADLGIETESTAPWEKAGSIPQVEWRLNTFRGDWLVPAVGYRNLMHFLRKPVEAQGNRAWVHDIRTVVPIKTNKLDAALADALAKSLDPHKTLLYLSDWRRDGVWANYPDYTAADSVHGFVEHAHTLGFHVMLHTLLPGVSAANSDYARVKRYQVKDPRTAAPLGRHWDGAESDPQRLAFIDPAAKAYRDLFVERIGSAIEGVQPDAIDLEDPAHPWNDGSGVFENKNFAQGTAALDRALLSVYPNLVLGGERLNELTAPYLSFAQREGVGALPPHPISAFLFGDHVLPYAALDTPDPDRATGAFLRAFTRYEGQGVAPTPTITALSDLSGDRPGTQGVQRMLALAKIWQAHDLQPDWKIVWENVRFRWRGADNAAAILDTQGPSVRLHIGDQTLYQHERGANQLVTSDFIPGWPAYDDGTVYGLDPAHDYWLDSTPRPKEAIHVSELSHNVLVTGAQVTSDFALFQLTALHPAVAPPTTFTIALPSGVQPVGFVGADKPPTIGDGKAVFTDVNLPTTLVVFLKPGPLIGAGQNLFDVPHDCALLSDGVFATVLGGPDPGEGICGGITKPHSVSTPTAPLGQTVLSWVVKLPDVDKPTIAFSAGLTDGGTAGARFAVRVNGESVWSLESKESRWNDGTADLSKWRGQTVVIQLTTEGMGGDVAAPARWAEVAVKAAAH